MPRPRTTQVCNKEVRRVIENAMTEQGLTYTALGQRLQRDESSVRQFIRDVGTKKHRPTATTSISRALSKPGNWLIEVLREADLR